MNIAIIGLGLIGGSLAIDLKKRGFTANVIGVDANSMHAAKAMELGWVDSVSSMEEAVATADILIITIPVDALEKILPQLLSDLPSNVKAVIDMGSTKGIICDAVKSAPNRDRYVAAHPIAGTENTGPEAALSGLFDNKICIICDKEKSSTDVLEIASSIFSVLKMKVVYMEAHDHDIHLAYVSHLSHITSFALSNTVLEIEKNKKNILNLAGSGFASTVRLAKSSPEMWAPIFMQNSKPVLEALDAYIHKLEEMKKMINEKKAADLYRFMKDSNEIRKILN